MSRIRILTTALALVVAGSAADAGPPRGGFSPPRGGFPGMGLPFKPPGSVPFKPLGVSARPGIPGVPQVPGLNASRSPIKIPGGLAALGQLPGAPLGNVPGQRSGIGAAIGQQVVQNLISQIGTGGFSGGGYGGGGFDPGYDAGAAACPAPLPAQPVPAAEPAPASPAPPAGNTTAIQIVEVGRGPAARAGLQKGDIILRVDGQRTKTTADLTALLAASTGKSTLQIVNSDDGKVETREVAVVGGKIGVAIVEIPVQLDEDAPPAPAAAPAPEKPAGDTALQVTEVRPGHALDAGIEVNDVILSVDGKKVTTTDDLVAAFKASSGTSQIEVYRLKKGKAETVTMAVEDGKIGLGVKVIPIEIR